jgi:signal transduction histidine kinase
MLSTSLFVHNTLYLITGLINVILAIVVFMYGRKRMTPILASFGAFCLAVATFQISHLLGTNAPDAIVSRNILMFNLTDLFIGMFWTHWFLALVGKTWEQRAALRTIYATGLGLFVFFLLFPRLFLVESVPKLYFPFYYEAGQLYWVMVLWFFLVAVYYFYQMIVAYRAELDPVQKNRYRYVLLSMLYAFITGTTAFALVLDIPFDPLLSAFCGFYTIPLAYAIIKFELLDIRILAKRTFVYALIMILVGLVIAAANLLGDYFVTAVPNFPRWLISAFMAVIVGGAGIYIWRKARENDIAKYEFINVIMHKFRTPLTEVKWSTEIIHNERAALSPDAQQALDIIKQATSSVVELTNEMVSLSASDARLSTYSFSSFNLSDVITPLVEDYRHRFKVKKISLTVDLKFVSESVVYSDPNKIKFAVEIVLNNALEYTLAGGAVKVSLSNIGDAVLLTITDNGIGISKATAPLIFSKFYRGENAKRTSTEGTGIGLYLAHEIVRRGGGTLTFTSAGEGHGTTFTMSLPVKV